MTMTNTTRWAIEYTDLFGAKYLGGARYTDKARALAMVRFERLNTVNKGTPTGAIPGYGIAKNVTLVEVA